MDTADKNPVSCFDFLFFLYFSSYLALCCSAANRITPGQYIKDGEFLVSDGQNFELGFFSPNDSTLRYVGIWYHNVPETPIIWVANRDKPIIDKAGVLTIGSDGNLVIFDGKNNSIWSSNALVVSENTTAILDKSGNLILLSSNEIDDTEKAYWQSFNNPTDTFLPSMRVNVNAEIGENHAFTSWKSANDPSLGNYSMGVDPKGSPQIVIWKGSERKWRSGHWNSQIFTGIPNMSANLLYGFRFSEQNKDGNKYFTYVPLDSSDKMRFLISWEGYEEQLRWNDNEMKWDMIQSQPSKTNECDLYNKCGNFGVCSSWESPICSCMQGFQPRDSNQWNKGNWSGGCSRKTSLQCQRNNTDTKEVDGKDGFVGVKGAKLPDFADLISGDMEACKDKCSGNCSCTSYSYVNGIGCMIWKGELIDIQHFKKGGNMLFIRLAHADLGGESKLPTAVIIIISVMGSAFLGLLIWLACRCKSKLKVLPATSISAWKSNKTRRFDPSKSQEMPLDISGSVDPGMEGNQVNGSELPIFNFNCIAIATNNFSEENKLGQGGFGPVYMGSLPGGQEIAVKRLSRKSGQGVEEFKNEISLMAKLHHRNLVRLLGCSIQGEDKMLIYEYMPNKSLDFFIFDSEKQTLLDWRKRFTIIEGIARGLLYLHRDSRLRIIHRDLKASNVLLDEDMNPKISDFGMARIFGGNQDEANTNRVVGTYGYMSPEYAMEGLFSIKSDVYSFGVLLLEIVSGRKNTSFRSTEYTSLLVFAWHLWNEGKAVELIDSSISDECHKNEVLRCIQIGMLCVQDSAVNRPTMSSVVLMLESESVSLPLPRKPTLTLTRHNSDGDFFSEGRDSISINEITVTVLDGR